ncbi:carboxymuconolactone decarboxylase family protein [Corynebacterium sp. USCH3]|uniref:carboxymuconolactone decarboxylase family protein n=1 Tax=Corynebacterium sp. USCH3 TaxID=3024840 RepID=UPI00309D7D9E
MTRRPYIDKIHPDIYRALNGTVRAARKSYADVGLPVALVELVNVRVSQINGCPTCLSVHIPTAREAGVDQLLIDLLPSWRQDNSGVFTASQRAALELAEALTEPQPGTGRTTVEQAVVDAGREFDEAQLSALQWAIILINAYNRVSIGSGHPPVGS